MAVSFYPEFYWNASVTLFRPSSWPLHLFRVMCTSDFEGSYTLSHAVRESPHSRTEDRLRMIVYLLHAPEEEKD